MQTLQLVSILMGGEGSEGSLFPDPARSCQVTVVCYFETDDDIVSKFKAAGAQVRLLRLQRSGGALKLVTFIGGVFRTLRPDVIHIQYLAPGLVAILAARISLCRRILATVHQPWTAESHGVKAKLFLRIGALLCSRFICVSRAVEVSWFGRSTFHSDELAKDGQPFGCGSNHCTIPNSIDIVQVDKIADQAARLSLRERLGLKDCVVVGAVSRLSKEKGIDVLLDAFAAVRGNSQQEANIDSEAFLRGSGERDGVLNPHQQLVLLIIGDGHDRSSLEKRARQLGLVSEFLNTADLSTIQTRSHSTHDVVWLGSRPWEEAILLMTVLDICVVPSFFEGFGLTAAEAMACHKVVIASNTGGLPDVVGTEGISGFLFPVGNPLVLAQKMSRLLLSKEVRHAVGVEARSRVERLFSQSGFERRIQALYSEEFDSVPSP